ncbi:MAG: Ldh family oxidoreductase, partial [Alphaproteobacteria bacterium]|nr:Ldh family oxidoreductase [Alphaproteobacteria bacterium]
MANYPTSKTDRRVLAKDLTAISKMIFVACGMGEKDAALVAQSLVHADLRGVHSHGVLRIPDYRFKLGAGGVSPTATPIIVTRKGGAIVVDG